MRTNWMIFFTTILFLSCSKSDDTETSNQIIRQGVFTTNTKNGSIEGELFLPKGEGPFPTLIIVPGSGNETREQLTGFVSIFNGFGYGLYIYDKRGIGNSSGSYPLETIENPTDFLTARADDVLGIVELLKQHEMVNPEKIGLFGSSQGTWVNTIVYDKIAQDIGLLVMASGGVTSTGFEHYYENLIEDSNYSINEANEALINYNGSKGYDPRATLLEVDIPTLFIFGGQDDSHPTFYDRNELEVIGKSNFSIHFYETADHNLLDINTGVYPNMLLQNLDNWLGNHK